MSAWESTRTPSLRKSASCSIIALRNNSESPILSSSATVHSPSVDWSLLKEPHGGRLRKRPLPFTHSRGHYLALTRLRPLVSWRGYAQVLAYLSCELVGDLGVSRNRRGPLRFPIDVDGVPAAFSQELAALTFQVLQQSPALHAPMGSRTTSLPSNSRRVSSLLASRTSETASRRLSRHCWRLSPWALAPGSSST